MRFGRHVVVMCDIWKACYCDVRDLEGMLS